MIPTHNQHRIKLLHESYEGMRDIKLTCTQALYEHAFKVHTSSVALATANNLVLGQAPYYFIEAIAFCGIVPIALYIHSSTDGIGDSPTILGLYGMIGFRLIPTFQRSYHATAEIKGAIPSFESIREDLTKSIEWEGPIHDKSLLKPQGKITLNNVSFSNQGLPTKALIDVILTMLVNTISVFTGKSGAGKSMFIDIILGLISSNSGSLEIDGATIGPGNVSSWQ